MNRDSVNWDDYLQIASISDIGMRRSSNQDSLTVSLAGDFNRWKQRGHLFIVADGMGAHAAGELASQIAAEQIPHLYNKYAADEPIVALKQSVVETNTEINKRGRANKEFENMGTTCSVMAMLPVGIVVAHVGDSRIYRVRNQCLEQLTFDHSLVWELRAAGQLSAADAESNIVPKNVITRSLGPYPEVNVDIEGPFPIDVGDTFLLCSDGLTGQVSDSELCSILVNLPPDEAVSLLTDLANLRGGPDNITSIVVQVAHPAISAQQPISPEEMSHKKPPKRELKIGIPVALLVGGIPLAVALGMVTGNWLFAVAPGIVALIGLVWLLLRISERPERRAADTTGKRFGKAPYIRTNCVSDAQLIEQLDNTIGELVVAAKEHESDIDWNDFNVMLNEAKQSRNGKGQATVIRAYARTIRLLMDNLRKR